MKTICVDPGHGMSNSKNNVYDPGAVHTEAGVLYHEATIALRYGLTLKDILRARGVPVFMTRDDETDDAPVGQRATNARNAGCSIYISLHLNSSADGSDGPNGVEVLYRDDADSPLARRLRDAVLQASGLEKRSNKKRPDLAVLKFQGPAALIELGFIRNDKDRNTLLNPQKRLAICDAIADVALA